MPRLALSLLVLSLFGAIPLAKADSCPPNVDPVYCQTAAATGGRVATNPDELASIILNQMDEATQKREFQNSVLDLAEGIRAHPAIWLLILAPIMPILSMVILRRRPPSRLNHLIFSVGCAAAPLLTLVALTLLTNNAGGGLTAASIGSFLSGALLLPAFIFSLIARHHKPTLWAGALILSGITVYGTYQLIYQGIG